MVRYARLHARRIGPSAAERPAYDGAFHLLVPDQTLRCGISGSELPRVRAACAPERTRAGRFFSQLRRACLAFLLRGSAAAPPPQWAAPALCRSYKHRLPLAVSGGSMDRTSGQGAAARGSVQRRKRKFHAGNTPDRERILSKDTPLAHDLPAALLGDDGQRLYAGHQQPRRPKILCVGNNPDRQNIYSAALGLYNSRITRLINK